MASEKMEQLKAVMQKMMAIGFAPKFDGAMDPIQLRNTVQAAQERMPYAQGVTFTPVCLGGVDGEKCSCQDAKTDYVILYIHGGGLICGNAFSSRGYASNLVTETHRVVYTLSYRLAPENTIDVIYSDAFAFYKGLTEIYKDTPIFLIGESGGAYLCLSTAELARDEKVKDPAGIVPYSAPIDFYGRIDRNFEGNKDFTVKPEFMDSLQSFIDPEGKFSEDCYANPYLDDLKGLPPVFLAWDQNESLAVDQKILVEKLQAAGGSVEYYSYPDCFHAFATTGRGTPESSEIMDKTFAFFERYK